MKNLFILLITVLLASCCTNSDIKVEKKRLFYVSTQNGHGCNSYYSDFTCDSINMLSDTSAIAYIDGTRVKIFADRITISIN